MKKEQKKPRNAHSVIERFDHWWTQLRLPFRLILLSILTGWLVFRSALLIKSMIGPVLELLRQPPGELQAYSLVYIDFLILISVVLFSIFLIVLFAGHPNGKRRFPLIRQGHPVLTFIIYTSLFAFLTILLPGLVYKGVTIYEMDWLDAILPNTIYLKAALCACLAFGLSLADIASKSGAGRWWSLPFLIIVSPFTSLFPLMWWNALAGWAPSRLWSFWRPILTALTCLVPLFTYPLAQPVLEKVPTFDASEYSTIQIPTKGDCYGITVSPDQRQAFIRCTPKLYRMMKKGDGWVQTGSADHLFQWNEASFDFERNRVHIYAGDQGKLYTSRISDFMPLDVTEIPVEFFPTRKEIYHQCFDPVQDRIVVAENEGLLMTIDASTLSPDQSEIIRDGGELAKILCLPDKDELIVLQTGALSIYKTSTLQLKKKGALPFYSYGISIAPQKNRVYISYPTKMKTVAYSLETFEMERVVDAPLGVRPLAVDEGRGLLFMAALGGTILVLDTNEFQTINRLRISIWPRRLAAVPEAGDLIITGRGVPVSWNYASVKSETGYYQFVLSSIEQVLARVMSGDARNNRQDNFDTLRRPYFESLQKDFEPTGILVAVPDPVHLRLARKILELKGHKVFIAGNPDRMLELLESNKEQVRVLVLHSSFYKDFEQKIEQMVKVSDGNLRIIKAHEIPFDDYDPGSNLNVILPFSLSELQYKAGL